MFEHSYKVRVRYVDTDQMGVVYYGNYARYYEIARTEAMRSLGLPYSELEKRGVIMPVVEMKSRYRKAAHYDEQLRIKTQIRDMPGRKITFYHQIFNAEEDLLHEGMTTLLFVEKKTERLKSLPKEMEAALKAYF